MARSAAGEADAPDPSNPRIVRPADTCDGEPRIAGTRIRVASVHDRVAAGECEAVADRHDLAPADVYRALAYYHEHPEELARIERERVTAAGADDPAVVRGPEELDSKVDATDED